MPRIIFIRPAETDYSEKNTIIGRADAELNEKGAFQAEALADVIAKWDVSYLGVSPIKRALTMAMKIADRFEQVSVQPVAGFQPMDMGDWQDCTLDHLLQTDRARYTSWLTDPDFRAPGGESIREVYGRAFNDLAHIVQHTSEGETLVFILQESVLKVLCCGALDLPLESANRFAMDPGGYAVFERIYPSGPYAMVAWNQTDYLSELDGIPADFSEVPAW